MPGLEAAFDGLLALAVVAILVAHLRARRARRDVSVLTAVGTGIVLGLAAVLVACATIAVSVHAIN